LSNTNARPLTGRERFFDKNEIIVSKTDLQGRIQYANRVFMRVGMYEEKELLGAPHSILRHPDMPRCVFKLLWDQIQVGHEVFAYVINRAANGDYYWVLAHVTPSYGDDGAINGYHSNRRVPSRRTVDEVIIPTYKSLLEIENKHSNAKEGMNASYQQLHKILKEKGSTYDEFIFSLQS
jgi:PAS domain S-box-containing protein